MDVDAIVFLLIPLLASIILSAASIILSAEGHGLLYQLSPVSCAIPACPRLCSLPISINDGTYNVTIYFSVIFHYES